MKIAVLQVDSMFQPASQNYVWPPHNQAPGWDFGVEQDFAAWLPQSPYYTGDPADADWLFAPIWWNRYFINNRWGEDGREALAAEVERLGTLAVAYNRPWFSICEHDITVLKPWLDRRGMVMFCASRRQHENGYDLPLLSAYHPRPATPPAKRYRACFLGSIMTDGIRIRMFEALRDRPDCRIEHENYGPDVFAEVLLASYVALAPRGQGGQSFRFYEALQLGTVPLYLSDEDYRPFPQFVDWDACSLFYHLPHLPLTLQPQLGAFLDGLDPEVMLAMGRQAQHVFDTQIGYGQWCQYVIRTLEGL